MKKILYTLVFLMTSFAALQAQHPTCTGTRYLTDSFAVDTIKGITFGNNTTVGGVNQDLKMDIFLPLNDTAQQRPTIVLAFGGSFIGGQREDMYSLCQFYAQRGYVAVTIDYRLYDGPFFPFPDSTDMADVTLKAISDMKAAVRYLREDAATTNLYKIDPNYIFSGGISAGGITAAHVAYVDSTDTIEPFIMTAVQNNGGWTGNSSTNTQYSAEVQGVINFSGGLRKGSYIDANDPPLFSVHDDADGTVPYARGSASVGFLPIMQIDGSFLMDAQATTVGVPTELITIPNSTGHVSYFQDSAAVWRDTVLESSLVFVHNILCPSVLSTEPLTILDPVELLVYPNPSFDQITLELGNISSNYDVLVFDNMGRLVHQQMSLNNTWVNLSKTDIGTGMYHVQIQFEDSRMIPIGTKVVFQ